MSTKIFVNLRVNDATASRRFWNDMGYATNEAFTSETTSNAAISDEIFLMLIEPQRFSDFVAGEVVDPVATGTSIVNCLSVDNREDVDATVERALGLGATPWTDPEDHGFMYGRSFRDLDGHAWEIMWMDPAAAQSGPPAEELANA